MSHDRIDTLIRHMRTAHLCAIPADVLIVVQESVRLAARALEADDPTSASVARNALLAACRSLDSYAGERA